MDLEQDAADDKAKKEKFFAKKEASVPVNKIKGMKIARGSFNKSQRTLDT